jgi:hypothetical protein
VLSPAINDANELVTRSFNEILQLDRYARACNSTQVGMLPSDPDWMPDVRNRIGMLSDAGKAWFSKRPDIWSTVLVQFPDYISSLSGVAESQASGSLKSKDAWLAMLTEILLPQLNTCVTKTEAAADQVHTHYQAFKDVQPLLDNSIQTGWSELADEEQKMVRIAAKLATLQTTVANLEGEITSTGISGGKTYFMSSVSIAYGLVASAGATIPFLSIASLALTVGKAVYEIIENSKEVTKLLGDIADLQVGASESAQAAAGTKALLQALYDFEKAFLGINDALPAITTMWRGERTKVQDAISALKSGSDPNSYIPLVSIPTANANWKAIGTFVQAVTSMEHSIGKAVVLTPGK